MNRDPAAIVSLGIEVTGLVTGFAEVLEPLELVEGLPNSGSILRSLGAASRPEYLARRFGMNINSATTRQVLNSLDMKVVDFIGKYRAGGIRAEFPAEFLDRTIGDALSEGGSKVRKLLVDGRFVK